MSAVDDRKGIRNCGLIGLDRYIAQFGDSTAQDAALDDALAAADAKIHRELKVTLATKIIVSTPDAGKVSGVDYDIAEEPYDYHRSQYAAYGFLVLNRRPVVSVQRVRLMMGALVVATYPSTWIRLNKKAGQISIVPTPGEGWSGMVMNTGQYMLPYLTSGWVRDDVPQIISVDYTVGLGDTITSDPEFTDLKRTRYKLAARELLLAIAAGVSQGAASRSIGEDGANESVSYSGLPFAGVIGKIDEDYKTFKDSFLDTEVGVRFTVV